VSAGRTEYDLSGVGWATVAAARVDLRLLGPLVIEPGLELFRYGTQGATKVTYLMSELSLQVQASLGPVHPYFGTGVGWAPVISGPRGIDGPTLHAAAGSRVDVTTRVSVRGELRIRAIDPWGAAMADITAGIGMKL
jgi:hypothetical protein